MFRVIEVVTGNESFSVKLSEEEGLFLSELKRDLLEDGCENLTDSDVVKIALDYGRKEWKCNALVNSVI